MNKSLTPKRLFTRRAIVFGAANLTGMSVLLGRLYYLQFLRAEEYKTLAEGNRVKLSLIAPVRGLILDRKGVALVNNQKNFRLYLDTEAKSDAAKVLASLGNVIEIAPERVMEILEDIHSTRYPPPALIKEHLSWDELSQFEFNKLNFPEVYVDSGQVRYYPFGERAAHLLGYVAAVDKNKTADNADMQKLSRLPDFKIGKSGVEKALESDLQGTAGTRQTEVNVHGLGVRELGRDPGKPGKNIRLTIDAKLQEYAAARLGSESAAAVVMNVHNGDVLALASMPAYDPNSFSKGITTKYWAELNANPRIPLMNKAIAGQYPPGSTFKLSMALAALDAKVVSPSATVFCNGHFTYGNHTFTCWKTTGHGTVDMKKAIQQSCDVYFYTMAERLGIDNIATMARKLGMGKATGVGLSGEMNGIVPDDAWKRKAYDQSWMGGDTISVGIGQGYIITTPLQLAVMTARIANGGFAVKPRLVDDGTVPHFAPLGVAQDHIAVVHEGMNAVCNIPGGTAYSHRIQDPRFPMAGKTGTSQFRKLVAHGIVQEHIPWEQRYHAWFVGFAPVQTPKYAASVIVEHGGGGASAAAPIVSDILLKIQALDAGEVGPVLPEMAKPDDNEEVD
jgi:penicillin-binding protein 2